MVFREQTCWNWDIGDCTVVGDKAAGVITPVGGWHRERWAVPWTRRPGCRMTELKKIYAKSHNYRWIRELEGISEDTGIPDGLSVQGDRDGGREES